MSAIDRDGVIAILTGLASETADVEGAADRILALVAEAVLDRVRAVNSIHPTARGNWANLDKVADEFGVES